MASVRPHSMRKFLTTEIVRPATLLHGRSAAVDSPCATDVYANEDCDVVAREELRKGEVELNYRQVRLGAVVRSDLASALDAAAAPVLEGVVCEVAPHAL
eukprot:8793194-Alexandrium_andersonii.AAC.1